MRRHFAIRHVVARTAAFLAIASVFLALSGGRADEQEKGRRTAPADHAELESDMSGSYFVTKELKDKYDSLVGRVAELRVDIDQARIDESQARAGITKLQSEIDEVLRQIEKSKLYVPGATVQHRPAVQNIPLGDQDLLLIEADNVDIQRGDGPLIKCVVKKTVLGELDKDQDFTADFNGIELNVRKSSGKEMFGFYKDAAKRPDLKHHFDQFAFKPFLDREFTVISLKGLSYEDGNRQILVDVRNEHGSGTSSSQWRRHAKLSLTVPKCQGVAIQGGLAGLRVRSLDCPLMIQGAGPRDYRTRYQVTDLNGPLIARGISLHDVESVTGDVSIVHTAYTENILTIHGPSGVAMQSTAPKPSSYKAIRGNLEVKFCRAELTIEDIGGRMDVENEFGRTVWNAVQPIAKTDHRIVSQSGAIEVSLTPSALGGLNIALFSACGSVRLPGGDAKLESKIFHSIVGHSGARTWYGFISGDRKNPLPPQSDYLRLAAAFQGDRREPGIDILSRAGTVTFEPTVKKAPAR